jgi:hypothetical protein
LQNVGDLQAQADDGVGTGAVVVGATALYEEFSDMTVSVLAARSHCGMEAGPRHAQRVGLRLRSVHRLGQHRLKVRSCGPGGVPTRSQFDDEAAEHRGCGFVQVPESMNVRRRLASRRRRS